MLCVLFDIKEIRCARENDCRKSMPYIFIRLCLFKKMAAYSKARIKWNIQRERWRKIDKNQLTLEETTKIFKSKIVRRLFLNCPEIFLLFPPPPSFIIYCLLSPEEGLNSLYALSFRLSLKKVCARSPRKQWPSVTHTFLDKFNWIWKHM